MEKDQEIKVVSCMEGFHLPLLKGFFTGAGLVVVIGAQDAFILKQGLMKHQVFITAFFCTLFDALLIGIGVGGFSKLFASNQILLSVTKWGGAAFLFCYGASALWSAFRFQGIQIESLKESIKPSLKETLLILLALCFLNPHVYLDTIIFGSISAQFASTQRALFAFGAMVASMIWFFGLCYGARLLAPIFENKKSWKVLDFIIGIMMWLIAISFFWPIR